MNTRRLTYIRWKSLRIAIDQDISEGIYEPSEISEEDETLLRHGTNMGWDNIKESPYDSDYETYIRQINEENE